MGALESLLRKKGTGTAVAAILLVVLGIVSLCWYDAAAQPGRTRISSGSGSGTLTSTDAVGRRHSVLLRPLSPAGSSPSPPLRPSVMPSNPAIIIFCYARAHYLNQTLRSLGDLEGLQRYTVYVSQDGNHTGVASLINALQPSISPKTVRFEHWQKARDPHTHLSGPELISQHYKWGLTRLFKHNHSHAIILEEDMLMSPDFLVYFEATAWLLDADPTLWCISSWNDNGYYQGHDWDSKRMFRTSFFPGLGWMMRRATWEELEPHWVTNTDWDWGLRQLDPAISRDRECVCPELSRNRNIGAEGINMNAGWFKDAFASYAWATAPVYNFGDLSYLLEPGYSNRIRQEVAAATPLALPPKGQSLQDPEPGGTYIITFTMKEDWPRVAEEFHLWTGEFRAHHHNLAVFPWRGATVLLVENHTSPFVESKA